MDIEELAMIFVFDILNDNKNKVNYALALVVSEWATQAQKGQALSKLRQAIRSHRPKEPFHHCPQLDRHFTSFLFPRSWSLKYKTWWHWAAPLTASDLALSPNMWLRQSKKQVWSLSLIPGAELLKPCEFPEWCGVSHNSSWAVSSHTNAKGVTHCGTPRQL